MSKNEQLALPPQPLDIPQPEHMPGYVPFGQDVIKQDEYRLSAEMHADWYDRSADYNQQMGFQESGVHRLHHEDSGLRYIAGLAMRGHSETQNSTVADRISADQIFNQSVKFKEASTQALSQIRDKLQEIETLERDVEQDGEVVPNEKRQSLNAYLETDVPVTFQNSYEKYITKIHDRGRVDTPDRVEWLAHAGNETLVNFLQWHDQRTMERNRDPQVCERIDAYREEMKARIADDVASGELPSAALDTLARIDNIKVTVGDVFDLLMTNTGGYHIYDSGRVVVEEDFDRELFRHEMYHAVFGKFNIAFMNEAMTEHLTLAAVNGDYQTVMPSLRGDKGKYVNYRSAMAAVLTSGINSDLLQPAIAAFIEGDGDGPTARDFHEILDASYGGVDVFAFLEDQFSSGFRRAEKNKPDAQYDDKASMAASYIKRGITILGVLARGGDRQQLLEKCQEQSPDNTLLREQIEEVARWAEYATLQAATK